MPSYKRPGVFVEEITSATQAVADPNVGVGAFMQAFGRGPTLPTLITSWNQFLALFGGFGTATQFLPYSVFEFFANGGRAAYVWRAVGTGAVKATRTLNDRAGTPLPTLRVDADNEGAWGNSIYIDIIDSGVIATDPRFTILVKYGGTADSNVVERWPDLSMLATDGRYAPSLINNPSAGSNFITVTDLNSATPPGATGANRPAAAVGQVLATGADGSAPTSTQMQTAVALLDPIPGPMTLNIPATVDAALLAYTLSYADGRDDVFVVVDTDQNLAPTAAVTFAQSYTSPNAAIYYPWLYVSDPSSSSQGASRKVPPGGAVVGQYMATETLRGVGKAPAGLSTRISGALAVETKCSNSDLDNLNTGAVNAIRQIPGAGIVIMGARTCKNYGSDRYVSTRRSLNYIKAALERGTQWVVFEPNDATLWSGIRTRVTQFLTSMWRQRVLRGTSVDEAFYVKCDSENNDPTSGVVYIEVGVALQFPAEFVVIRIGQWDGGSTATVVSV